MKKLKKEAQNDLKQKMMLFEHMGDRCNVCDSAFDKKDKEMVKSWYVVVREDKKSVNLYCPSCWQNALHRVHQIQQMMNEVEDPNDN